MNLDHPDDLGIIHGSTGVPLLWERHGSTLVYTSAPQQPQDPQCRAPLPGQEPQP